MADVSVAIPVRNGGRLLERVLSALARQTVAHELLVCDSGSCDGSAELARAHGARVLEIEPEQFGHGRTRNLLVREARGAHVALLTQDAEPVEERWLEQLLEGFSLAPEVGLVYGPYVPREDASLAVRIELESWFAALAPDGRPRVDRLMGAELPAPAGTGVGLAAHELLGPRGFFTDANACIARAAWERVGFRELPYAEDRALALDMLRAGYAKVFVPTAAVVHSHDYTAWQELRRGFDEWRGLRDVYGWREPASPAHLLSRLRGAVGQARRDPRIAELPLSARAWALAALAWRTAARLAGALLGSRAERLPARLVRRLSLERRASSAPRGGQGPA
jgi:GT2 family glycosyltransferase